MCVKSQLLGLLYKMIVLVIILIVLQSNIRTITRTILLYSQPNNCDLTHMLQKAQPLYDYRYDHFKQSFL